MKKIISMTAMWAILFAAGNASAYAVTFCARWEVGYEDSGMGSRLNYGVPAAGGTWHVATVPRILAQVQIAGQPPASPQLTDSIGCTVPYVPPDNDTIYVVTFFAAVEGTDGHAIRILRPDVTEWTEDQKVSSWSVIRQPGHSLPAFHLPPADPTDTTIYRDRIKIPHSEETALLPVAYELVRRAPLLPWDKKNIIHVATTKNTALCPKGSEHRAPNYGNIYRVCMSENHDTVKAVLPHEAGHAIALMNNVFRDINYRADEAGYAQFSPDPDKKCLYDKTAKTHSYHSREFVGTAAAEGFSHFISTLVFNDRWSTTPEFDYYKSDLWDAATLSWRSAPAPYLLNTWSQHTKTSCQPPSFYTALGSERDWLQFFWGIWAEPTTDIRFSVDEIMSIWKGARKMRLFDNVATNIHSWCAQRTTTGEPGWTCKNEEWVDSYVSVAHDASGRVIGAGHVFKATTKYLTGIPWEDVLEEASDQYESSNLNKYNLFLSTGRNAGVTYR